MDFNLSEQQLNLQSLARVFARENIRPRTIDLDKNPDPSQSWPYDLFEKASKLGLRTLKIPKEFGGQGIDTLTELIVLEELCVGDISFGSSLAHPWREGLILASATTNEQRELFLKPFLEDHNAMTSIGITELHSGSDNATGYDKELKAGSMTEAIYDGSEWVLNGRKIFITAGNVAQFMLVVARTNKKVSWKEGISIFIVPTNTKGYQCIRVMDKLGMRVNPNTEVVFTNCRVPKINLIGELNNGYSILSKYGASSKVKEGVKSLGAARAAYEEALNWCQNRHQGGKKLIEHQSIAHCLARMAGKIEACRSLCWRAGWSIDHDPINAIPLQTIAKIETCEMAAKVAVEALELFGGYGVLKEYPIEKIARDAITMLHTTGGQLALTSSLAEQLNFITKKNE
jgi:alkylation response protein AidB-like acyl-CoA dehydrogenase